MDKLISSLSEIRLKYEGGTRDEISTLKHEFEKILLSDKIIEIFEELSRRGILNEILPDLVPTVGCEQDNRHHKYDVFHHILHSVDAVPKDNTLSTKEQKILRWTMLLHDIAKPQTKNKEFVNSLGKEQDTFYGHAEKSALTVPRALEPFNMCEDDIRQIQKLVKYHDELINYKIVQDGQKLKNKFFIAVNEKNVEKLIQKVGERDFKLLVAVIKADNDAQSGYQREQKESVREAVEFTAKKVMDKIRTI